MISSWVKGVHLGDRYRAPYWSFTIPFYWCGAIQPAVHHSKKFLHNQSADIKRISIKIPISLDNSWFCCYTRAFQVSKKYIFHPRKWTFQRTMNNISSFCCYCWPFQNLNPWNFFLSLWKKMPVHRRSLCSVVQSFDTQVWSGAGAGYSWFTTSRFNFSTQTPLDVFVRGSMRTR